MKARLVGHLRAFSDWRRKRFWALIVLLLYTLTGFFAVPRLIERSLVQTIEDTGRSIEIAEISETKLLRLRDRT